jgi:hypothetical protein
VRAGPLYNTHHCPAVCTEVFRYVPLSLMLPPGPGGTRHDVLDKRWLVCMPGRIQSPVLGSGTGAVLVISPSGFGRACEPRRTAERGVGIWATSEAGERTSMPEGGMRCSLCPDARCRLLMQVAVRSTPKGSFQLRAKRHPCLQHRIPYVAQSPAVKLRCHLCACSTHRLLADRVNEALRV